MPDRPEPLTRRALVGTLREAGVAAGDVLMIQSNLVRLGPVETGRGKDSVLGFYLTALREAVGERGTLVVLTSFEDYARYGVAFDRRHSPSRAGAFSEFMRTMPGTIRSRHPVLSVAASGPAAHELCDGAHFDGFGYDSAWGRLHRMDARILTLGYALAPDGMTFCHYIENLYGVPYQYTKLYDHPVLDDGVPQPGTWTMPVRYLDFGVDYDQTRFKRSLRDAGLAQIRAVGRGEMLTARCADCVAHAVALMRDDRYLMLSSPPRFRRGEIPFDVKGPPP